MRELVLRFLSLLSLPRRLPLPKALRSQRLGYVAFFLFAFVVSLYWTFPEAVVSARLEQEVLKASRGDMVLRVGKAHLWRLSGLHAEDVKVRYAGQPPFELDTVRLRVRLAPLLLGRLSFYGQVMVGNGSVDVVTTRRGSHTDLHVNLDAFDLARPPALGKALGLALAGTAFGELDLEGFDDLGHGKGRLALKLQGFGLGPGELKGLSVPQLPLGNLECTAELTDGTLQLKNWRQDGGSVQLSGGGKAVLNRTAARTQLDLCFRVGADKAFLEQNPKISGLLQLAQTQVQKDSEGMLNVPLHGPLFAPEVRHALCPRR